jgi:hypothetical protein
MPFNRIGTPGPIRAVSGLINGTDPPTEPVPTKSNLSHRSEIWRLQRFLHPSCPADPNHGGTIPPTAESSLAMSCTANHDSQHTTNPRNVKWRDRRILGYDSHPCRCCGGCLPWHSLTSAAQPNSVEEFRAHDGLTRAMDHPSTTLDSRQTP